MIMAFIILTLLVSLVISSVGYYRFTTAFQEQYEDSAYRTGETAKMLLDANKIDDYIASNGEGEEYTKILTNINYLCEAQNVSIVYVIKVSDDFSEYISVFNAPNMKTTKYTPWPVGTVHEIEDGEYREMYKKLYAKEIEHASAIRKGDASKNVPDHITSLIAMYDDSGNVTALMCVQRPMSELSQARRKYMLFVAIFTVGLLVVIIFAWYFYLKNQFVKPLNAVVEEAERFAKKTSAPDNPLDNDISRITEIASLARSLNNMEQETLEYIDNLTTITKEKERYGAELDVAKTIQENSLPREFPPFPEKNEISIYASMTPAKQVGGDFYDFFFIDDDHLALVIADVSGKGVPAALFMMVTRILINEIAKRYKTAAEIMTAVNERICEHNQADMFVTIWLGIIEISTGKVDAVNAGHDDPAIYKVGGFFGIPQSKHGFIVGGMSGIQYKGYEFNLNPGDKLFLYTDGVPEATRADKAMFKTDGMIASLQNRKSLHPSKIVEGVKADVERFVGDAPQFDDMTMLCLEYKGKVDEKVLEIDATDENLDKVNEFVETSLREVGCKDKLINQLLLATEEVFVNIAHYAYAPKVGKATIKISMYNNRLKLIFIDSGKEYDPLGRKDPDVTLSAEDRKIGGLGIYMTKKLVDGAFYRRKGGKNILVLEKEI